MSLILSKRNTTPTEAEPKRDWDREGKNKRVLVEPGLGKNNDQGGTGVETKTELETTAPRQNWRG